MLIAADAVASPERMLRPGWLEISGSTIRTVGEGVPPGNPEHDLGDAIVSPGFIDLHAHGGGGAAFTNGAAAARTAREAHLHHGTTTMLASLVSATVGALAAQCEQLVPLVEEGVLAGIHLEGPWLAPKQSGAHDVALLRRPSITDIDRVRAAAQGTVRMVTLAPELPGALDAVQHLTHHGVVAAIGHSDATYDQARAALLSGASVVTHLYNAMRPFHHREPGIVGAALADRAAFLEVIADGTHLHPAVVARVLATHPARAVLVSDAISAAGAEDGDYRLGDLDVQVRGGVARLFGTDTIAGSTLTLDAAVRYAVEEAGVDVHAALRAATTNPAQALDLHDRGRIAPGADADIVVLSPRLEVTGVLHQGRWIRQP